jgi:predicted permease
MSNLLFLFLFLLLGFALQGPKFLPRNIHLFINLVILRTCLPAAILLSVPSITWSGKLLTLGLAAWIIFGVAFSFFNFYGQKFGWYKKVIGCLILTAGLGNTSFIGFPVILAMLGQEAFTYAVVFDQTGTFLICSTLGIWLVNSFSSYHLSRSMLVKRIIQFPPFLVFYCGHHPFVLWLGSFWGFEMGARVSGCLAWPFGVYECGPAIQNSGYSL